MMEQYHINFKDLKNQNNSKILHKRIKNIMQFFISDLNAFKMCFISIYIEKDENLFKVLYEEIQNSRHPLYKFELTH